MNFKKEIVMDDAKIGIVGLGNLGAALYKGFTSAGKVVLVNNGSMARTQEKLLLKGEDPSHAVSLEQITTECRYIFVCVKPQVLVAIAPELNRLLTQEHFVFSCLAMDSLRSVENLLQKSDPIAVKVMPPLGVFNRKGIVAYQLPFFASYPIALTVKQILGMVSIKNHVYELESEEQMQFFTIFVACFPGIVAHFVNQFSWRARYEFEWYPASLPDQLRSIADLLEESGSASKLWEQVATKGGVTRVMTDVIGHSGLSNSVEKSIHFGLQHMRHT